jgi:hypothetical protein
VLTPSHAKTAHTQPPPVSATWTGSCATPSRRKGSRYLDSAPAACGLFGSALIHWISTQTDCYVACMLPSSKPAHELTLAEAAELLEYGASCDHCHETRR